MKIIKAMLFTMVMFVMAFALVSLPVIFGGIGAIVLFVIIFLLIFFAVLFGILGGD